MGRKKATKPTKASMIREYITKYPFAKAKDISKELGLSNVYVHQIMYNDKKAKAKAEAGVKFTAHVAVPPEVVSMLKQPAADPVNHPPHYKHGGVETIDFIEAKGLGYHLGNVVKYISRAGLKGTNTGLEDLKKARWYLDRAIEKNEVARPTA